jgi:hypothetical protein
VRQLLAKQENVEHVRGQISTQDEGAPASVVIVPGVKDVVRRAGLRYDALVHRLVFIARYAPLDVNAVFLVDDDVACSVMGIIGPDFARPSSIMAMVFLVNLRDLAKETEAIDQPTFFNALMMRIYITSPPEHRSVE